MSDQGGSGPTQEGLQDYPILSGIDVPGDLRQLEPRLFPALAAELRRYLIKSVSQTGGHLAAGLGVVELTIACTMSSIPPTIAWSGTWGIRPIPTRFSPDAAIAWAACDRREACRVSQAQRERIRHLWHRSLQHLYWRRAGYGGGLQAEGGASPGGGGDWRRRHGCRHAFEALNQAGALDQNLLVILNDNEHVDLQAGGGLQQPPGPAALGQALHQCARGG